MLDQAQPQQWTADDLPVMVEQFAQVNHWIPLRSPFDKARQDRIAGLRLQLAITTDGYEPKGEILLARTGDHGCDAELAYAIGPRYHRQRLATRAVKLITSYAYDVLPMKQSSCASPDTTKPAPPSPAALGSNSPTPNPSLEKAGRYPLHTWRHHRHHHISPIPARQPPDSPGEARTRAPRPGGLAGREQPSRAAAQVRLEGAAG
ncbi:GNAT family N-acetyltransferase [Nonomuraea sp. NPDC049784]|uniref:GNAT family N-acetyltransferase n=1 Tax=Nonomuraea sp. NPDC049784 TaxID=3154361 RepID=UPI0033D7E713